MIKNIRRKYWLGTVIWEYNTQFIRVFNNTTSRYYKYLHTAAFSKSYTQSFAHSSWTIKVQLIRPNWLSFVFWMINNRDGLINKIHVRCLSPMIFPPLLTPAPPPIHRRFLNVLVILTNYRSVSQENFYPNA